MHACFFLNSDPVVWCRPGSKPGEGTCDFCVKKVMYALKMMQELKVKKDAHGETGENGEACMEATVMMHDLMERLKCEGRYAGEEDEDDEDEESCYDMMHGPWPKDDEEQVESWGKRTTSKYENLQKVHLFDGGDMSIVLAVPLFDGGKVLLFGERIGAWRAKREIVSFRVVRACGAYVMSDLGENPCPASFPFPNSYQTVPCPALQAPIQLQLALSVFCGC